MLGFKFKNMLYAEHMDLEESSKEALQQSIDQVHRVAISYGLSINVGKSKIMCGWLSKLQE